MKKIAIKKGFTISNILKKNNLRALGIVFGITILAATFLNVLVLLSVYISNYIPENLATITLAGALILSLAVMPKILYKKIDGYDHQIKLRPVSVVLIVILSLVLIQFVEFNLIIHFLAIGISEEILFRDLHLSYLQEKIGTLSSVIITSLLFALILHMGESLLINLLVRFPIGLILSMIRIKLGLAEAIGAHWLYDVVVTII